MTLSDKGLSHFSRSIVLALLVLAPFFALSQNTAVVFGKVTDERGRPLELVNISIMGVSGGTSSDAAGKYELKIPAGKDIIVAFSILSYSVEFDTVRLAPGERIELNVALTDKATILHPIDVTAHYDMAGGIIRLDPRTSALLPTYGGIETLVKLIGMGVSSGNELSSTYSVRGGNFDENIVYANDIEIYRPFLVRSGQQEGLSFLNSSLVNSVSFSSGGFEARYGDKMSSVLDVQYKRPDSLRGDAHVSLLGANVHVEGKGPKGLMTFLTGFRYKSTQYVLNAMETKGDYKPSFLDWQNYLTWQLSETSELSILGYMSSNKYNLVPETRETTYGTVNQAYRLTIYFDGMESDRFTTFLGGARFQHYPNKDLLLKYIVSAYSSLEDETYDIQGQYWIGLLESDMGSDQFGEVAENMGVGTFLDHARNYLDVNVFSAEHKGMLEKEKYYLQWGVKAQHERVLDEIWQWNYIDSSGYSLPHVTDSVGYTGTQPYQNLVMSDLLISNLHLTSMRYSGYIQNGWEWNSDSVRYNVIAGVRSSYWDVNQQLIVSPRAAFSMKPNWDRNYLFRFATGMYQQPPFYRELRDMRGNLHTDVKAQQSIHFVAGFEHTDSLWDRPFRVVGEVYYKALSNMIPYVIDNVRIRYLPEYRSHGYATGIDLKMNGQFVPDAESWVSISIMQTREDIEGDFYNIYLNSDGDTINSASINNVAVDSIRIEPGYIPRPADQRVNVSLFFQDYLPNNPSYKMHLSLVFGTGLPFGPPNSDKYKQTLRMPPYRRVDIGFSKQLAGYQHPDKPAKVPRNLKFIRNAWLSLEIFNLLNINNTVSYIWVTDVENNRYAVPNYLTKRQLNLKLLVEF